MGCKAKRTAVIRERATDSPSFFETCSKQRHTAHSELNASGRETNRQKKKKEEAAYKFEESNVFEFHEFKV